MALFHNRIPRHGDFLATGALGICLAFSLVIFARAMKSPDPVMANAVFDWLPMTAARVLSGGILVDHLAAVMLVVVCLVSFLVYLFSIKYMEADVRYGRYYCGLLLFTVSMLGLVLADNMLFLYIFWELVGLSSYLLIGHWFEKKSASDAAVKAFITTRLGDVGMFIGIMVIYWKVGSLQYADVFAAVRTGLLAGHWQTIAGLGIFFGAMGKSAQFPLHVWLPDAMEGPTPVSALIHAATMVAAGVYLTARLLPIFDPPTLLFIAYIGGITALFAATIALVQDDIKKVLAYSTVSQLGYMIMAIGVGGYVSGMFHLTTHASFKAGLFLGSGAVIYAMHHEQSLSRYGGLWRKMPWTAACYLLATLALCGVPPFSGFWSKDAILGDVLAFSLSRGGHWFLPIAGFGTAFLTAFYMFRQYFLTFAGKPRDLHAYEHAREVPWQMLAPLVILGVLALVGGGTGKWFGEMNPKRDGREQIAGIAAAGAFDSPLMREALGTLISGTISAISGTGNELRVEDKSKGSERIGNSHPVPEIAVPEIENEHLVHTAHATAMKLSVVLAFAGILLGGLLYFPRRNGTTIFNPATVARRFNPIYKLLWNKYYLDEIYMATLVMGTRLVARLSALFDNRVIDAVVNFAGIFGVVWSFATDLFDRLMVDGLFVNGSAWATRQAGEGLSYSETGRVRQYLVFTVAGLLTISGVCAAVFYFF